MTKRERVIASLRPDFVPFHMDFTEQALENLIKS